MSIRITSGIEGSVRVRRRDAVPRAEQADVGAARDQELLDQHQVGRVVLDIEQGVQRARRRGPAPAIDRRRFGSACAGSWAAVVSFSSIQNTLPSPTVLSTPITPPINSTSRLVTTRPMPVPSSRRPPAEPVEGLEQLRQLVGRQSLAGVRTLMRIESGGRRCTPRPPTRPGGCT
jgi:hypothetical protein